ncbi:MAG TPA: glycosyltransferase family 9 protein [Puia sp.]|nr:glycosyltransferase family 9 protein [Puia sp.]
MNIPARPWTKTTSPRRVLAIRLQAMGDMAITLPYLQGLRNTLPSGTRLDLLTREEVAPLSQNIHLFDNIYTIGGGRSFKKIFFYTLLLIPRLWLRRYEVIIDLQNNIVSQTVRKTIRPAAWSEFDRFSKIAAGERTRLTIEAVGLGPCCMDNHFRLKDESRGIALLQQNGWNGTDPLVVLNPAGFVVTRNWSIPNYIRFARLWLEQYPDTRFLVLGTPFIAEKAHQLKNELGDRLLNLVGQTTPLDAFAVLQKTSLVLSEDSGLMHMAWTSGIPTMVLFGSTSSYWSRPLGTHSHFLDSADLPCGNCMQAVCAFGDIHCLTRYTPELVFGQARRLIQQKFSHQVVDQAAVSDQSPPHPSTLPI